MKDGTRLTSSIIGSLVLAAVVGGLGYLVWQRAQHEAGEMYHTANTLFDTKQYPQAEELFTNLLKRRSARAYAQDARYKLARLLTEEGRYGEAADHWALVAREPGDASPAEVTYYQGVCAEQLGDTAAAGTYFNRVRAAGAGEFSDNATLRLGRLVETAGDFEASRLHYELVVRESSNRDLVLAAGAALRRISLAALRRTRGDENHVVHLVRRGENLQNIAQHYGSTVELIMEVNGLSDPSKLRRNQRLVIPRTDFSISINKTAMTLTLFDGDAVFAVYPVGLGKDGSTPAGAFTVVNKIKDPTWWSPRGPIPPGDPENELGSRWMGLKPLDPGIGDDYGIHSTIRPDTIGQEASNGCPRMYPKDAEELFSLIRVGTPVRIDPA